LITKLDQIDFSENSEVGQYQSEILESLFDIRMDLFRKYAITSLQEICVNEELIRSFKYITPHMLKHFNIQGISEKEVITSIVRFMAF
jgi:hypothetical protein